MKRLRGCSCILRMGMDRAARQPMAGNLENRLVATGAGTESDRARRALLGLSAAAKAHPLEDTPSESRRLGPARHGAEWLRSPDRSRGETCRSTAGRHKFALEA